MNPLHVFVKENTYFELTKVSNAWDFVAVKIRKKFSNKTLQKNWIKKVSA